MLWYKYISFHFLVILITGVLHSCSTIKSLPAGEKLYVGYKVELQSSEPIKDKKEIKKKVKSVVKEKTNSKVLGMPLKLWAYNFAGNSSKKGIRNWIKHKLGEAPILFSNVSPTQTAKIIDAKLYNSGIFKAYTTYEIIEKNKKVKIKYKSHIHSPYTISAISWPAYHDILDYYIENLSKKTILKSGNTYDLDDLKSEQIRIDNGLKDEGFYFFKPEYILFLADTSVQTKTVNISVTVNDKLPKESRIRYRIHRIYVYPNYSLERDSLSSYEDTARYENVYFIGNEKNYRFKTILRAVFLKKDDFYSRKNHNMTLSRLMGMGVFKYVNIRFSVSDTSSLDYLDVHIYLTSLPIRSIRAETDVISKSNNFMGPSLNLNYRNRNTFKGAELLSLNLHASFETQLTGQYKGLFSYEFGPQIDFTIPRFVVPFSIKRPTSFYIPKTRFTVGYDFLKRAQYFTIYSFKFVYGYKWKESITKEHELNPINISFTQVRNRSILFEELLLTNALLEKSFEEQFIAGLTYSFTYNEQLLTEKRNQFFFKGKFESSGNLLSLVSVGGLPQSENPAKVLGAVYAQFAWFEFDFRDYYTIDKKNKIATRFYSGIGFPYGNSMVLPYIKQFFSGGANSVRAFKVRSLGPGTYIPPDSIAGNFYFEQGGDIKIEANAEYRFSITQLIKGVFFIDVGNTWLLKENSEIKGGQFKRNQFISEMAVGTGVGLRLDVNFFVIRLDLSFPVKKPWLPKEQRWVMDELSFGNSNWRKENLILNIAIGYPF